MERLALIHPPRRVSSLLWQAQIGHFWSISERHLPKCRVLSKLSSNPVVNCMLYGYSVTLELLDMILFVPMWHIS